MVLELDSTITEDYGFRLVNILTDLTDHPFIDSTSEDNILPLGTTYNLLAWDNINGRFALADSQQLILGSTSELFSLFSKSDSESDAEIQATTKLHDLPSSKTWPLTNVSQIYFSSDCNKLIVGQSADKQIIHSIDITTSSTSPLNTIYTGPFKSIKTSPHYANILAILTSSSDLLLADIAADHVTTSQIHASVTGFDFDLNASDELVVTTDTDDIKVIDITKKTVAKELPSPLKDDEEAENFKSCQIVSVSLEKTFIIFYKTTPEDGMDIESRQFIISASNEPLEITNILFPAPDLSNLLSFYSPQLTNWSKSKFPNLVYLLSSLSPDIVTVSLPSELVELMNDSDRALLPLDQDTYADSVPVGLAVDLSNESKIVTEISSRIELAELDPLPRLMVLSNEGKLCVWDIFEIEGIKKGDLTPVKELRSVIGERKVLNLDGNAQVDEETTSEQKTEPVEVTESTEKVQPVEPSKPVEPPAPPAPPAATAPVLESSKPNPFAVPGAVNPFTTPSTNLFGTSTDLFKSKPADSGSSPFANLGSTFSSSLSGTSESKPAPSKASPKPSLLNSDSENDDSDANSSNEDSDSDVGESIRSSKPSGSATGPTSFGSTGPTSFGAGPTSFGAAGSSSAFGKSSFGSSGFGNSGSTAFGKSTGSTGFGSSTGSTAFGGSTGPTAFGGSTGPTAFGSSTGPTAFGSKPLADEKTVATGPTSFGSTSGAPAFGSGGFGSSAFGKSAFGSSAGGPTAFGSTSTTTSSPFGSTATGATPFGTSTFGNSTAFGSFGSLNSDKAGSTASPFALLSKKESPFGSLALKDSPFAGFGKSSDKSDSPFGSLALKDSPFAGFGKSSDKTDSPFSSLMKNTEKEPEKAEDKPESVETEPETTEVEPETEPETPAVESETEDKPVNPEISSEPEEEEEVLQSAENSEISDTENKGNDEQIESETEAGVKSEEEPEEPEEANVESEEEPETTAEVKSEPESEAESEVEPELESEQIDSTIDSADSLEPGEIVDDVENPSGQSSVLSKEAIEEADSEPLNASTGSFTTIEHGDADGADGADETAEGEIESGDVENASAESGAESDSEDPLSSLTKTLNQLKSLDISKISLEQKQDALATIMKALNFQEADIESVVKGKQDQEKDETEPTLSREESQESIESSILIDDNLQSSENEELHRSKLNEPKNLSPYLVINNIISEPETGSSNIVESKMEDLISFVEANFQLLQKNIDQIGEFIANHDNKGQNPITHTVVSLPYPSYWRLDEADEIELILIDEQMDLIDLQEELDELMAKVDVNLNQISVSNSKIVQVSSLLDSLTKFNETSQLLFNHKDLSFKDKHLKLSLSSKIENISNFFKNFDIKILLFKLLTKILSLGSSGELCQLGSVWDLLINQLNQLVKTHYSVVKELQQELSSLEKKTETEDSILTSFIQSSSSSKQLVTLNVADLQKRSLAKLSIGQLLRSRPLSRVSM